MSDKVRLNGIYLDKKKPSEKRIIDFIENHILKSSDLIKLALLEYINKTGTVINDPAVESCSKVIKADNEKLSADEIDIDF